MNRNAMRRIADLVYEIAFDTDYSGNDCMDDYSDLLQDLESSDADILSILAGIASR